MSAAAHRPTPVDAVGGVVIDHVPISIRESAIRTFGHSDKTALRLGILVILSLAAAAIGVGARRHRWVAVAGVSAFTLLGVLCAVSRHGSSLSAVWGPCLRRARRRRRAPRPAPPPRAHRAARHRDGGGVRSWPTTSRASTGYERRRFLGGSIAAVGVAATATALARSFEHDTTAAAEATVPARLPTPVGSRVVAPSGASLDATTPYVTPVSDFYRIDTSLVLPRSPPPTWQLRIHGMVDRPVTLTYAELIRPGRMIERDITLTCVSNGWAATSSATPGGRAYAAARPPAQGRPDRGADQIVMRDVDGFTIGVATDRGPGRPATRCSRSA